MPAQPAGASAVLARHRAYVALLLAAFTILFGTRHLDATEHHEGMVAAIAFESLVKLLAFLAVGVFVTFGIYDGLRRHLSRAPPPSPSCAADDLSSASAAATPAGSRSRCCRCSRSCSCRGSSRSRSSRTSTSATSTRRSGCFRSTCWRSTSSCCRSRSAACCIFPDGGVDADTFVLDAADGANSQLALALLVVHRRAVGGDRHGDRRDDRAVDHGVQRPRHAGAAALRIAAARPSARDLTGLLLGIRRGAIVLVLLLGYLYFRLAGEAYALVSIGLISFAAVAQFAPAMLGGMFWKRRHARRARSAGSCAGFAVWFYTLLLPSFASSGWLPIELPRAGPVRHRAPEAAARCSASTGLDQITHCLFWSMLANIGAYVGVSLLTRPSASEAAQACASSMSSSAPRPCARSSGAAARRSRAAAICCAVPRHRAADETFAAYARAARLARA